MHIALVTGVLLGVWSFIGGLLQGLLGFVDPASFDAAGALGLLLPLFLVCLLNVLVITWIANRTTVTGVRLGLVIFVVVFGVMFFMTQIETVYFNSAIQMPSGLIISTVLTGAVVGLVAAWLLVRYKQRLASSPVATLTPETPVIRFQGIVWKIGLMALLYVVFYFVFGYFIAWQFSALREFYSGSREMLSFPVHMQQQFQVDPWLPVFQLIRGAIWACMGLLVASALNRAADRERMVIVGLSLSVGLSTLLLVPNPYMPDSVRLGHFFELLLENFLFGVLLVRLFRSSFDSRPRSQLA
jgi:hypothetical protein